MRGGAPYESTWLTFDRLVTYDDKLKPLPMLAESWDVAPDYKQVQLNLRKGVTWHTGREFTSDDVKWNFIRVQDPKAGYGDFAAQSAWFTTIDTPDKYTVVLKSEQSRPSMFDFFQQFNMGDREVLEGPDAKTKSVGTGPFMFVEWVQGDHITIARTRTTGTPANRYWTASTCASSPAISQARWPWRAARWTSCAAAPSRTWPASKRTPHTT